MPSDPPPPYSENPLPGHAIPTRPLPESFLRQHRNRNRNSVGTYSSTSGSPPSFTSTSSASDSTSPWWFAQLPSLIGNFRGRTISTPGDICSHNVVTNGSLNFTYGGSSADGDAESYYTHIHPDGLQYSPRSRRRSSRTVSTPQGPRDHLHIRKSNQSIQGTYTIAVPPSQSPIPGHYEDERRDCLVTTSNGKIDVQVTIIQQSLNWDRQSSSIPSKYVELEMSTTNGGVRAEIIAAETLPQRRPLYITLRTTNGTIRLRLPRTFQGLVISELPQRGLFRLKFARDVEEEVTMISGTKFFVGDVAAYASEGLGEMSGRFDVARVGTTNGNVHVEWAE